MRDQINSAFEESQSIEKISGLGELQGSFANRCCSKEPWKRLSVTKYDMTRITSSACTSDSSALLLAAFQGRKAFRQQVLDQEDLGIWSKA